MASTSVDTTDALHARRKTIWMLNLNCVPYVQRRSSRYEDRTMSELNRRPASGNRDDSTRFDDCRRRRQLLHYLRR